LASNLGYSVYGRGPFGIRFAGILVHSSGKKISIPQSLLPDKETKLETGDVLVLRGTQENLAAAEIKLLQG